MNRCTGKNNESLVKILTSYFLMASRIFQETLIGLPCDMNKIDDIQYKFLHMSKEDISPSESIEKKSACQSYVES